MLFRLLLGEKDHQSSYEVVNLWPSVITGSARPATGYHSGMNALSVTNYFLVGLKACFLGGSTCLALEIWPNPMAGELTGPRYEPTTNIFVTWT